VPDQKHHQLFKKSTKDFQTSSKHATQAVVDEPLPDTSTFYENYNRMMETEHMQKFTKAMPESTTHKATIVLDPI
jgi:predicted HAD superfamily phosphohydrolase YqeG